MSYSRSIIVAAFALGALSQTSAFQAAPQEGEQTVLVTLLADGTVKSGEDVLWDPKTADDLGELRKHFDSLNPVKEKGGTPVSECAVIIRADNATHWEHVQRVIMIAAVSGFYRLEFETLSGEKLPQELPHDKELGPAPVDVPELQEIRLYLCAKNLPGKGQNKNGNDYDIRQHRNDKRGHEELRESRDGTKVRAWVESFDIGELELSDEPTIKEQNQGIYQQIAKKADELRPPSSQDPVKYAPTVIDACSEVPYEHFFGVLKALREQGIQPVELVGSPRLEKEIFPPPPKNK